MTTDPGRGHAMMSVAHITLGLSGAVVALIFIAGVILFALSRRTR